VAEEGHIHLPNPSYYPLLVSLGLVLVPIGILVNNPHFQLGFFGIPIISAIGFFIMVMAIYGWSFEPAG
jgi:uncharacterized membrane protein